MEQLMHQGLEFLDDHESPETPATPATPAPPATCVVRTRMPHILFSFQRFGFPRSCERFPLSHLAAVHCAYHGRVFFYFRSRKKRLQLRCVSTERSSSTRTAARFCERLVEWLAEEGYDSVRWWDSL